MGMQCMTAFVKEKNMLKPHKLRDSKLIIDGFALFLSVREQFNEAKQSGNEQICEEYYDYLKQILTDFVECQIQCYVIFDGGDNDVSILKKIMRFHKALDELETAMSEDITVISIPYSYDKNAMMHILNELGIPHATCCTQEADEVIPALAKHFDCPILSNDSDFFLSAAPLIPISSCTREHGADFINCKIFHQDDFLQAFQLKLEVLPIILTVLTNDYFEPKFFDMFFRNCGISTHVFHRIGDLLTWLSTQTYETAVAVVLKYLHRADRQKCVALLQTSKNITTGSQTENYVFKYLTNPPSATVNENDPDWFSKGIVSGRINETYINMCKRNLYLWHPAYVFIPSLRIVRYAFDLLTGFSPAWFVYMGQKSKIDRQVKSRDITNAYSIKAPQLNANLGPLFASGWDHLPDYFEHFVRETLPGFPESALNEVPEDCRLWLLALVWWKTHVGAKFKINVNITHCLILCRIRGALLAPERAARLGIDNKNLEQAMKALKRFAYEEVNIIDRRQQQEVKIIDEGQQEEVKIIDGRQQEEVKIIDGRQQEEVKIIDGRQQEEVKIIDGRQQVEVKIINESQQEEVKIIDGRQQKEVKIIDGRQQEEVKIIDGRQQEEVKIIDERQQEEEKIIDGRHQEEVKIIDGRQQEEVKIIDERQQEEEKIIDGRHQEEVKIIDGRQQEKVKIIDERQQEEVKIIDGRQQEEVKIIDERQQEEIKIIDGKQQEEVKIIDGRQQEEVKIIDERQQEEVKIIDGKYQEADVDLLDILLKSRIDLCLAFLHILDQLNCLNTLCASPYNEVRLYECFKYNFLYSNLQLSFTPKGTMAFAPEKVFKAGESGGDVYKKLINVFDMCIEAINAATAHSTSDTTRTTVKTNRTARCDFYPF